MSIAFVGAIVLSVGYFLVIPICAGSPFHSSFHYVCHFSVMLMGSLCYLCRDKIKCEKLWKDVVTMAISFVLYFVILKIGKGHEGFRYYLQVLALVPLHTFVYYSYKAVSYPWCERLFLQKKIGKALSFVASLTLEIYVVQFALITDRFNALFPLNVMIVFSVIVLGAYFLHILTSLFLKVMS